MHKEMWQDLHKQLEKLMAKDMTRCPAYACHEIQVIMNEIEQKHTGQVEYREVEG
ncbi:hypothetical protein [Macrococcus animalis]|uniref:hypothetical protein n=1 Tax=Macrococcus animalis TaxID=3395467 RepID=UPI0039BDB371